MYTKKNDITHWKLWFKIIGAVLVFSFILKAYIEGIVGVKNDTFQLDGKTYFVWGVYSISKDELGSLIAPEIIGYDYLGFTINFFSYFTNQSNILVGFWFLIGAIKHNGEGKGKMLGRTTSLSVVTYITVTCLIFNFMLLPTMNVSSMSANWWINQMVLHTIVPIMAVVYFILFMNQTFKKYSFIDFIKKDFWKMTIYPLVYLVYALIRGEMIFNTWGSDAILAQKHNAYPYFFLEIHNKNALAGMHGLVWLLIAAIAIIAIIIGLGSLFSLISSKKNQIEKIDQKKGDKNIKTI